eukprot:GHVN01069212.1.p2 GENE.GHVN01069212.1~~GHVN01069212.1.p2  ORF type:complete len:117 (-),score=19.99 GHVN01069212.1:492-842(-)
MRDMGRSRKEPASTSPHMNLTSTSIDVGVPHVTLTSLLSHLTKVVLITKHRRTDIPPCITRTEKLYPCLDFVTTDESHSTITIEEVQCRKNDKIKYRLKDWQMTAVEKAPRRVSKM